MDLKHMQGIRHWNIKLENWGWMIVRICLSSCSETWIPQPFASILDVEDWTRVVIKSVIVVEFRTSTNRLYSSEYSWHRLFRHATSSVDVCSGMILQAASWYYLACVCSYLSRFPIKFVCVLVLFEISLDPRRRAARELTATFIHTIEVKIWFGEYWIVSSCLRWILTRSCRSFHLAWMWWTESELWPRVHLSLKITVSTDRLYSREYSQIGCILAP